MKKLFGVLLLSTFVCTSSFAAKDRLPADLSGVTVTSVATSYQEGNIAISFNVNIPANYFERRVSFVLMPALSLIDGTIVKLSCKGVQGTSVIETNYPVVDWSKDQTINYETKIPARAAYLHSTLVVDAYIHNCLSKASRTENIYTGALDLAIFPIAPVVLPADVVSDATSNARPEGRIYFKLNSYVLTKEGTDNPSTKKMNDMIKFLMQDPGFVITSVDIFGNASPEGTDRINVPLAANRAKAAITYMKQNLKTIGYNKTLNDNQYQVISGPDFFEEFFMSMTNSNHPQKNAIISEFLNYKSDPLEAEKRVRTLMQNDQSIRDIMFPDLRYSAIRVNFTRPAMTPAQVEEAAILYPGILSALELTSAAEAQETLEGKIKIYETALGLYPTIWELYANLGNVYLKMGYYDKAQSVFEDALKLSPNNNVILAQMAYTHIATGNYDKASQALQGVSGPDADYYRGIILMCQGKYIDAIPYLKKRPDVNLAIAQLSARETRDAYNTLQSLNQENVYVAFYTGVALRRLNRDAEANTYFNKAQQLNRGELNDRMMVDYEAGIYRVY